MAVLLYNSTSSPFNFSGTLAAKISPPATSSGGTATGTNTGSINAPQQIMGAVPVFPCCITSGPGYNPAKASFTMALFPILTPVPVQYLVVGGGGGGGVGNSNLNGVNVGGGGGGGGGGVLSGTVSIPLANASYPVVVGAGGAGANNVYFFGGQGGSSSFNGFTALGGGRGASYQSAAGAGGSGGGGVSNVTSPGGGYTAQGFSGGTGVAGYHNGGGGGGYASVGQPASGTCIGGNGTSTGITGSTIYISDGGGGGGLTSGSGGIGGSGGNGSGFGNGGNGTTNRGGGGGGSYSVSTGYGGNGGSGVVILSYPTGSFATATGGTITTNGGNKVHTFNSGGIFAVTYTTSYPGAYVFNLVISGTSYAISIPAPTTSVTLVQIQNIINTAIAATGITCSLVIVSGSLAANTAVITATLIAPNGSSFNGTSISFTGSNISIYGQSKTFTGGIGSSGELCGCDCRQGDYLADSIPDDRYFTLPVFGDNNCTDSYHNDLNAFAFLYPGTYNPITNGDFILQKLSSSLPAGPNSTWNNVATLNNTAYGKTYFQGTVCTNNIAGFQINWGLVLAGLGAGTYRFYVGGSFNGSTPTYCLYSPPFCLNPFDCNLANGTVKFEATYCGGNFGSVTDQGVSWSLCCTPLSSSTVGSNSCITTPPLPGATYPVPYYDSIRFGGYMGRQEGDYEETKWKIATGVNLKTRQELIKNISLTTDLLPWWFHERFMAYMIMADFLYASDYNMNNPNYNIKFFNVMRDASYTPRYDNNSLRYKRLTDFKFKEQTQLTFRDTCC